ncbi:LysM domain receptor-like kinase [Quillaja saponaria]|uniref:LysM domain receptor-like kinase n=1 Tax=Quillaja saponaria TaxID=32244 RepID=A0AAD7M7Y4_QUISA|nr:LysM domain receptor-like kinase [Quillaja saponaria]
MIRPFCQRKLAKPYFSAQNYTNSPSSSSSSSSSSSMCKTKTSTDVIESRSPRSRTSRTSQSASTRSATHSSSFSNSTSNRDWSKSSVSSRASLSSLKDSLPDNPHIFNFSEICSATRNFLADKFSSSSTSTAWRCSIRNKEVVVIQRKFRRPMELPELRERLSVICRSHHSSLIKLLGASVSGNYIYLVYDYVHGVNLADCLRNRRNPNFTVLSNWLSRMQIATDLAHGLDYIHHFSGLNSNFVHNHIKSSSIIVTDETLNAKICHFGTSELCGEVLVENPSVSDPGKLKELKRSGSRTVKFEGTRGYMAPENQITGISTQKTDVYAFGVVILELLCGEEALKYKFNEDGDAGYRRLSVIDTAREAVAEDGSVRKWVDRRLRDSFPVDVAEKMVWIGLECVEEDPEKRPDMGRVAILVSKLYLESKKWAENIGVPTDFSFSLAPR